MGKKEEEVKNGKRKKHHQTHSSSNSNEKKKKKQQQEEASIDPKKQELDDNAQAFGSDLSDDESASFTSSSDSDVDSQNGSEQEEITADFEFFDPKRDDFHGVKNLVSTFCDGKCWDLNGFVEIILAQTSVGTVIKTDEDCIFGLITVLNCARYENHQCIKDVHKFLLENCFGEPKRTELQALWHNNKQNVGLLVCERVINLPFELVPPLYDALFNEVSWATEDEPTQELRESFQLKQYLILTRIYQTIPQGGSSTKKKKKKKVVGVQNAGRKAEEEQYIYIKPEDEIFQQLCSWSYTFPVEGEHLAAHEMDGLKPMRLVMAIGAEKIESFRVQLKALQEE